MERNARAPPHCSSDSAIHPLRREALSLLKLPFLLMLLLATVSAPISISLQNLILLVAVFLFFFRFGFRGIWMDTMEKRNGDYAPLRDSEDTQLGKFDKPLPCFGCGIGWFSLLLGFVCPLTWYYATILYFGNYHHKDPRERAGLAASAIAALLFSIAVLITIAVFIFKYSFS